MEALDRRSSPGLNADPSTLGGRETRIGRATCSRMALTSSGSTRAVSQPVSPALPVGWWTVCWRAVYRDRQHMEGALWLNCTLG